ncbi:MAG TPA: phosphoadenosine phosphosulfate reductase family protein [Steroidobacteraceae bacterium]|nr:phosphoadenosine phosphosulfate reductase family protein [Steroidobacteraceae bacterium]
MKHIVGFSGGIDSQACARWVLNRYPKDDVILTNTNAGRNESPLTDAFVAEYSRTVHPVTVITARMKDIWETEGYAEIRGFDSEEELTFGRMIAIKGRPPSRKAQFCTSILKLRPQRRWMREQFGPGGPLEGEAYTRYAGVRRDESAARAHAPFVQWDEFYDCELHYPITDWSKAMCFAYVEAHGEAYNPLYKLGFSRVGCAPCINSGKDDILLWRDRFPDMIEKVRGYERDSGRTFFPPCVPGLAMNTIDEVIAWAETSRGGYQPNMLRMFNERPACESKYGLCE